ncbi:hypothetical protein [Marinobacter similis]|uniref:Uncharacterized protein n=1 Tax=Marinobacter similis TaxID=1420916 RepID=W5YMY7_9GAMM|nr:hypothetical protein [Marinobacter similis]AHI30289.1 hypothetical protein AU14_17620 [Marinobacter similis]
MNMKIAERGIRYINLMADTNPDHAGWDMLFNCTGESDLIADYPEVKTFVELKASLKRMAEVYADVHSDILSTVF